MTNKQTGGPAFPCDLAAYDPEVRKDMQGMELLDYFASKAMQGYCANFKWVGEVSVQSTAEAAYSVAKAMMKARESINGRKIEDLMLTSRAENCLNSQNICTVEQLIKQTPNDLLRISSMGRKTLIEIQEALAAHGLKLRDPRNGNP